MVGPDVIYFTDLSVRERKIIFNDYILPFTLGVLSPNTGMRNSEVGRIKREDFITVVEKETFLLRVWNKKTEYFNKTSESKYRKIPLHAFTIEAVKVYIRWKEKLYGAIQDGDFMFGKATLDRDTGEIDGFLHYRVFDKAVLIFLKLIKHKDNFIDFFYSKDDLLDVITDIKALQEDLKDVKEAGKGISFYSFRKTFRTMLGLNNDLAEYYMGHKLGDNSKTTYIQVNSLDNKLFVEEYAGPVIAMLDKYIFLSEEETEKLAEELKRKTKKYVDFLATKVEQGMSLDDASIDYAMEITKEKEGEKENKGSSKAGGYFDRI
jgi:hypothetical protein